MVRTYRRSTRPPPEAQFSLKARVEFGTGVPFKLRALWAASVDANSTKQYPALLSCELEDTRLNDISQVGKVGVVLPRVAISNDLDLHLLTEHRGIDLFNERFVHPALHLPHPSDKCVSVQDARDKLKKRFRSNLPESLCRLPGGGDGRLLKVGITGAVHTAGTSGRGTLRRKVGHREKILDRVS